MTEHELRGLGRRQLLELMLEQGKDMQGNRFAYEVQVVETLEATAVEDMVSEEWDLTLFTCDLSGESGSPCGACKCKCLATKRKDYPNSTEKHRPERESWKSSLSTRRKARSRQSVDCHVGRMVEDSQSIDNFLGPPRIRVRNPAIPLGVAGSFFPFCKPAPTRHPPADRGNHLEEWSLCPVLQYAQQNKQTKGE